MIEVKIEENQHVVQKIYVYDLLMRLKRQKQTVKQTVLFFSGGVLNLLSATIEQNKFR